MALFCQQEFKSVASIVHNPTTNLVSSKYVEETNASLFRDIFSKSKTHDFQNLVKLIEKKPIIALPDLPHFRSRH